MTVYRVEWCCAVQYDISKCKLIDASIVSGPNSSSPTNSKAELSFHSTPAAAFDILSEPEALYVYLLFGLRDKKLGELEIYSCDTSLCYSMLLPACSYTYNSLVVEWGTFHLLLLVTTRSFLICFTYVIYISCLFHIRSLLISTCFVYILHI